MNDIKKIVLFKDENSKDGGSWLIVRDSVYEIVSLKEGKRICAEYAAMNGITTREMVNEQLLNKVVFYSSDFNSALRDYVAENVFYVNSNNTDVKNVHAENNDIVSGMTDNLSNDGDYMLAEDAEEVVETLGEKPNQFVMVGKPYTPVEISDGVNSSESLETSDSQLFSEAKDDLINKPIVEEKKPNQFVMVGKPYTPVEISDGVNSSESLETSDSQLFSEAKDDLINKPIVEEEKPNQFVMVGKPYTPVEISDGVNSSESLETSDSQLFSEAKDDLINKPIVEEEKPNQFVMVGKPYTPVEISDGVNSSESLETSDSQLFSEAKDDLINKPIVEEKKPNQFVMVENPYVSDDADDGVIESEEIGEEPISIGEEVGEEPPREDEHEEEPSREDEHEEEPPREDEHEEEPPREDEHEEEPSSEDEHEEEPPREDEHEEEPSSEDEHEEEPPREDEYEEEPPREDEHEEESPREDEHEEESIGDEDITIIDRIKSFGNNALKKLKELTFFGTIFGMVLAGIVTIFGVKYSLNRDKDDIYVTHSSNTEEIPDDEYLYSSPLAKFVDGVINKFFPTNESVTDEENEDEEILMGDDTDLEIDDNIDDNSNSPIQYIPYLSESEIDDNYDADETDFVETTTDTDLDENDFVEATTDTDIDENDFVEATTDTDIDETDFVETTTDTDIDENDFVEATTDTDIDENYFVEATANTDIDETDFVEITGDTDFYDITIDGNSEDVVLVNDEELSDEIEFYDGYNSDNTLNTTSDSSGDQTDLNLPDPNYSAYIDNYFRSLEFSGDVSESGKQYVKAA